MAGCKKGTPGYEAQQKKYRETMTAKFGSDEARKEYYRQIGKKGGQNGHTGGFTKDSERAREAGRKGGAISSRAEDKPSLEIRRSIYESTQGEDNV